MQSQHTDITTLILQCRKAYSLARIADKMNCPFMASGYRATGAILRRTIKETRLNYRLMRYTQAI